MVDPQLVIFAIQAGVRLGRKVYDVLVDETQEAALLLPLGGLVGSLDFADARDFFRLPANKPLIEPGGPYAGAKEDKNRLILAWQTTIRVAAQLGDDPTAPKSAVDLLVNLGKFEQKKKEFAARPPAQRILGTIVEIGIDYFAAHPDALGRSSPAKGVVEAFVRGLDGVDFAEGDLSEVVRRVVGVSLGAGLEVLGSSGTEIVKDPRVRTLLGGVTVALKAEVERAGTPGEAVRIEDLARRAAGGVLRGAAGAVADNPGLFFEAEGPATEAVGKIVSQVLDGVRDRDDLFTADALEAVVRSGIVAAADRPELFGEHPIIADVLRRVVASVDRPGAPGLFSDGAAALVARAALETLATHAATLPEGDGAGRVLDRAIAALAAGLGGEFAAGKSLRDLVSTPELANVARDVFDAVAADADALLGDDAGPVERTVLAQALLSVRQALAGQPVRLVAGQALRDLTQVAVRAAGGAGDTLVDRASSDPRTNRLFGVLGALAEVAAGNDGVMLRGDAFVATARRVLAVVTSADPATVPVDGGPTGAAARAALRLASTANGRVNRGNAPLVIGGLLARALEGGLALGDRAAVEQAARDVLRAA